MAIYLTRRVDVNVRVAPEVVDRICATLDAGFAAVLAAINAIGNAPTDDQIRAVRDDLRVGKEALAETVAGAEE
jgi:hypothetical protein